MLTATNLSKRYGARLVLKAVNFEIKAGEVVAVEGYNGAGKSTLLKIVAGLIAPSRGTVQWSGGSTRGICSLAAPDAPLYRELTCLENLSFFTGLSHTDPALQSHLARWGLATRARDFHGELSSGLRVRLQLAVASWHRAPVLLLDEPSANLDDVGRDLVAQLLAEQRERGVTLLATNDDRDKLWCDRRLTLGNHGQS